MASWTCAKCQLPEPCPCPPANDYAKALKAAMAAANARTPAERQADMAKVRLVGLDPLEERRLDEDYARLKESYGL